MKRILYPLTFFFITLVLSYQVSLAQPYTVIPPAEVPAVTNASNGGTAIELGMKFYVTQSGQVTDFRFYTGVGATGTYIGHLWLDNGDNTGTILATQSFTPNGLGGVDVVNLGSPVALSPGNTYVVSYYSADGIYAFTPFYFNSGTDVGADPIFGIDRNNDPSGVGNGVYLDAAPAGGGFPTTYSSDNGTNYYADVSFSLFFPLPVTLVDFKALTNSKNVDLSWKTQTENNNKGFEVQRSNNNQDWYTIGFVNGAGSSSVEKSYAFTDRELAPGRYYYRLSQQDFDGNSKASNTVTALLSGRGKISLFQNAPNPVRNVTTIRYDLPDVQHVRLSVVDLSGREIKVLVSSTEQPGSHIVTLDAAASGLSRQAYIIRLQTDNETLTNKMIVE